MLIANALVCRGLTRTLFVSCLCWASIAVGGAVWQPLERQSAEPDTLYLLDAATELKLVPGDGGLIPGDPGKNAPFSKVVPCEGKFRRGLRSISHDYGYVWMPSIGLIAPDEFTIEFWLKCDHSWEQAMGQMPFSIFDEHGTNGLDLRIHDGRLTVSYSHLQSDTGPVKVELQYNLKTHPLPANEWENLAITFKDGTLRLYINAKEIDRKAGIIPPSLWSDASRGDGLSLLGSRGRGADAFSLSDLRISRWARVPGEEVNSDDTNTLTVHLDQSTGQEIRQTLLGGLHYVRSPLAEKMMSGTLKVLRTDKMLVVTPIKAGEPDILHPSRGISGRYSYDWQVVDRTFDYDQRLGVIPYISIDATPQILGGSIPPMSGEKLTRTGLSAQSGFGKQMPADFEALGTMVRDLVHHAVIEMKYPVKYWGVWNEPNGPSFWNGTMEDYFRLYDVCAIAVKAVDPSLQIGGPEVAGYEPNWLEGLIQHCAREKVPLDFVSWHYYGSTVNEIPRLRAQVDYWAAQDGLKPGIPLICGEWCWHIHNFPRTGYVPWRTRNYYINDWHAAFVAASLIEMQRAGVVYGIYTAPVAEADGAGFDATGLASSKNPWANLNVFRLWSKLSTDILKTDYRGRPGIFALASRDPTGRITILLASLRYRKDTTTRIAIELPGLPKGSHMSEFDVDDEHSNEYDAGPAHAELEQVGGSVLQGSEAIAILKARSVHLLVIEPSK